VRELEIHSIHRIYSHTFFVTNVARQTCSASGEAFCHIAGPYAHVLGLASLS
jgi:hypothetical protein